jgi:hypothetical protein
MPKPMQNKIKDTLALAMAAIEQHKPIFIEELISYLPIAKPTFYSYFPIEGNDFNLIKKAMDSNRISMKKQLRANWALPEAAPTLQIALYKLLSTQEELNRLSNNEQVEPKEKALLKVRLIPHKLAACNETDDGTDSTND